MINVSRSGLLVVLLTLTGLSIIVAVVVEEVLASNTTTTNSSDYQFHPCVNGSTIDNSTTTIANNTNITLLCDVDVTNITTTDDLSTLLATSTEVPSQSPTTTATTQQLLSSLLDGMQGAIVTYDCIFEQDYPYAIDIFWSCGDEKFNRPLRLHTLKKHSQSHKLIFADQLVSYRDNGRLWFDAYNTPRCIRVDDSNDLRLSTSRNDCNQFDLLNADEDNNNNFDSFYIQDRSTGHCMGLGSSVACDSDQSTGGSECGGRDHRFLPLVMMPNCLSDKVLTFRFETEAQECPNERPENACF